MFRCGIKYISVVVCICLILGLGAWWLYAVCNGSTTVNMPKVLVCSESSKDFGETGLTLHEHGFVLTNTSSQPVNISSIGKSCSCMEVQLDKKMLKPNETATLKVKAETHPMVKGIKTHFRYELIVNVADHKQIPIKLSLSGIYVPSAYFLPHHVTIPAPKKIGETYAAKMEVFLNREKNVKITGFKTEGPLKFEASAEKQPVPGQSYEKNVVTIHGKLEAGIHLPEMTTLLVQTNSPDLPEMGIPVTLLNGEDNVVTIAPDRLAFGILKPDSQTSRKVIFSWSNGSDYKFKAANTSSKEIEVKVGSIHADKDTNTLPIICELNSSGFTGAISQDLTVELVLGKQTESYKIPISGFVKVDNVDESHNTTK